jgi:hypothetical protein
MKSPGKSRGLPEFLDAARQLGFIYEGQTNGNHVRLRNKRTGQIYTTALTPSDWRSRRNCLADLERISGRKLPRPNAAHYKKQRRRPVLDTQKTRTEQQSCEHVDELVQEAETLRRRFYELVEEVQDEHYTFFHFALVMEARKTLLRYEHLRRVLADWHRVIPAIESM